MTGCTVGFAGMTHLGINSAAALAARGFAARGYDPDETVVSRLKSGDLPITEPGLADLMAAGRKRLRFSAELDGLHDCDVVYISTDVPTDATGASDLSGIHALIDRVLPHLGPQAVLVVLCQVPPGFTRTVRLEPERLFYQVETLVFGNAVERATKPERHIVGCSDPDAPLPDAYRKILEAFGCPILPMRYESAELAKISINCCLVASISAANTLAELCERIGAEWSEIVPALRLDRRIGPYAYLNAGLGIAGGNLERDLATVCRLADETGGDAGVVRAWIANASYRKDWVLRVLHERVISRMADPRIAVLGLAYKQDTHSTKNSPALALLRHLTPFRVRAYDPVVTPSADWHPGLRQETDALAVCEGADAVAIMTPWAQFRDVSPTDLARVMGENTVIDPYRVLDAKRCHDAGLDYHTLGAPRN